MSAPPSFLQQPATRVGPVASSEYYSTLAQRCRQAATKKGKRRGRTNLYLLTLADRFDEAARLGDRALAGDKPQGIAVGRPLTFASKS